MHDETMTQKNDQIIRNNENNPKERIAELEKIIQEKENELQRMMNTINLQASIIHSLTSKDKIIDDLAKEVNHLKMKLPT